MKPLARDTLERAIDLIGILNAHLPKDSYSKLSQDIANRYGSGKTATNYRLTVQQELAELVNSLPNNGTLLSNTELQLADVLTRPGTVGTVTVKQIDNGMITFYRPYTHTADFSHTGGVICYIGVEEWREEITRVGGWTLIERKVLR
jgi:hypothetical protein